MARQVASARHGWWHRAHADPWPSLKLHLLGLGSHHKVRFPVLPVLSLNFSGDLSLVLVPSLPFLLTASLRSLSQGITGSPGVKLDCTCSVALLQIIGPCLDSGWVSSLWQCGGSALFLLQLPPPWRSHCWRNTLVVLQFATAVGFLGPALLAHPLFLPAAAGSPVLAFSPRALALSRIIRLLSWSGLPCPCAKGEQNAESW